MILVVPEHYGGLLALQSKSEACIETDNCEIESIFGIAIKALDGSSSFHYDIIITMPEFTVDTDVSVKQYLQEVSALQFTYF